MCRALAEWLFLAILELLLLGVMLIMIKVYTVSNEQNFYNFLVLGLEALSTCSLAYVIVCFYFFFFFGSISSAIDETLFL